MATQINSVILLQLNFKSLERARFLIYIFFKYQIQISVHCAKPCIRASQKFPFPIKLIFSADVDKNGKYVGDIMSAWLIPTL